jgi:hypothetical protein
MSDQSKAIRFVLPAKDLRDITHHVIRFYSNVWNVDQKVLENKLAEQFKEIPPPIKKQFQIKEGEFLFLADHEKTEINIEYHFKYHEPVEEKWTQAAH